VWTTGQGEFEQRRARRFMLSRENARVESNGKLPSETMPLSLLPFFDRFISHTIRRIAPQWSSSQKYVDFYEIRRLIIV